MNNESISRLSKYVFASLVVFSILVFSGCTKNEPKKVQGAIKMGAILPLTGDVPDQGEAAQKAILLAIDEINKSGGINGKNLSAVFEDSQCQAQKGVSSINKLIEVDHVDFIVGDICDSVTAAIMPIAENKKTVLITPGSTSPDISNAGDYIFRFWFSEDDLGLLVAQKARQMNYDRIAILYVNNAWGIAQKNGVSKNFQSLGGSIVSEQAIDPESVDYRTEILKSEESNPDAYYLGLLPNGLALSMQQMKERKLAKRVFSHGGLVGSTQTLGLGGSYLEGIIAPFVNNSSSDFVNRFKNKYDSDPGITADSAYDSVNAVIDIIRKENKYDSDTIRNGLYHLKNYPGASGTISVDENGDAHRPLQMMIVRNNKLVLYED